MYSVIIQNQKTMESFQEFYPLFMESINHGQIGMCRWMEPGTTMDTALPELTKMIEDKEEWRAIIVRIDDEEEMSQYSASSQNPFDFDFYHQEDCAYQESPVPLIRLTNILGEMPAPEIKYKSVTIVEENKSPKIIYVPQKSEEEEQIYQELVEKYDYDGKEPSEIVLISLRKTQKVKKEGIQKVWKNYNEIESSDFWKKNAYSTNCRFVVYDIQRQGNTQYVADMFKFWTTVLMFAKNKIDTDELQAYRLYKVDLRVDRNSLENSIQKTIDRLQGAKYYMRQMIKNEKNREAFAERKLPDYKIEVPVVFDIPRSKELEVESSKFALITRDVNQELRAWNDAKKEAEYKLKRVVSKAEIALDESAERMRDLCTMEESEVSKVDKYQQRMMDEDLGNLYRMMQEIQKELPAPNQALSDEVRERARDVKQSILSRITQGQIMGILGIICMLMALSIMPGLIVYTFKNIGDKKSIFSFMLLVIDIAVIPVVMMLMNQKNELKEKISRYNISLNKVVRKINDNAGLYSDFLSSIASHSRGKSYLHILKNKKFSISNKHKVIETHMRAIDGMLDTIDRWSKAFYLNVYFNSNYYEDNEFEIRIRPAENRLYTLEYGNEYEIPLNKSGQKVISNYEFITKMELVREELYD